MIVRNALRTIALRTIAVGAVVAAVSTGATGVASATPAQGVSATDIASYTVGHTDYVIRRITIAPGGSTGWHFHEGTLFAKVRSGTLTHFDHDCAVDGVYKTGDPVVEPSGANHVHIGRNLGKVPMVLDVLYVKPAGSPLADDAPAPACATDA